MDRMGHLSSAFNDKDSQVKDRLDVAVGGSGVCLEGHRGEDFSEPCLSVGMMKIHFNPRVCSSIQRLCQPGMS